MAQKFFPHDTISEVLEVLRAHTSGPQEAFNLLVCMLWVLNRDPANQPYYSEAALSEIIRKNLLTIHTGPALCH